MEIYKAKTVGELFELLDKLMATNRLSSQDLWYGWDDSSIIVDDKDLSIEP